MIAVSVFLKATKEPLKRIPVTIHMDADDNDIGPVYTDRTGVANFDLTVSSGKVFVSGVERYHGRLDGEIPIALWSVTESANDSTGTPGQFPSGSNAYPGMTMHKLNVEGRTIATDSEGYLLNPDDWSEAFVKALARQEGLSLNREHWEVIRFLRDYYVKHGRQASVREMIKYFRTIWGQEKGSNRYLHTLFPGGGPQKQGNRLAGLLRTKGEH